MNSSESISCDLARRGRRRVETQCGNRNQFAACAVTTSVPTARYKTLSGGHAAKKGHALNIDWTEGGSEEGMCSGHRVGERKAGGNDRYFGACVNMTDGENSASDRP